MTAQLRDELHRIADRAPVADVDRDTWSRARRARTRDRLVTVGGVAAMVVLAAALSGALPRVGTPPIAGSSGDAVPSHIWAVPERMQARNNDGSWMRSQVTSDVALGRAAAAYLAPDGLPVVIGASDGAYHLLDLPGFSGNNWLTARGLHPPALALSPDGRQLAYSWATFGPDAATEPIPSGVRVLDLTTGAIRPIALPGAEGTAVTALAWSPDSRWLAWTGARMGSWTTGSMGRSEPVAGRIAPGATTSEEFASRGLYTPDAAVAVDARGEVSFFDGVAMVTWDGARRQRVQDSDLVAVTAGQAPVAADGRVALPSYDTYALAVADPARGTVRAVDLGSPYDVPWQVRALGWVGRDVLIATDDDSGAEAALRLFSPDTGRSRVVGAVDAGVGQTLTVAVGLVTPERPPVDRPEPDWPWSDERRWLTIGLGVAVALGLAMGLRAARSRSAVRAPQARSAR